MNSEQLFNRDHLIDKAEQVEEWDNIIIGGGSTGLGIALDSATRGYKTLLLEQLDYAKGTSSRSTKLVHGGVRYLAQANISLVREALKERGLLEQNAPHLVKNQTFLIPNYTWWEGPYYTLGLKAYDFLAGELSLGSSKHISKNETIRKLPTIKKDKLRGSVSYQDGQFDDSRLAVNIAQTAIEKGGVLLNYFKVKNLTKDGSDKVSGVVSIDQETGKEFTFKSKAVINATGVFADDILQMDKPGSKKRIQPSQGVHLVFDKKFLPSEDAIMIPKTDDGRVLFAVPWHDKVIVGTTDVMVDNHTTEPNATEKEVDFILETFNRFIEKKATRDDIKSIYAGLRPLAAPEDETGKTKEISRGHKILVSDSGLISITGGKWTTYRKMAEDTLNKVISLGYLPKKECVTEHLFIHGAMKTEERDNHLYVYGSDQEHLQKLIEKEKSLGEKIHADLNYLNVEVLWAARHEMARTVEDVLARRVRVLFLDAKRSIEMAPKVAEILAKELSKDQQWIDKQIQDYTTLAKGYII
ncbi:glycerol-3-phosphate dehydrogenase/oxidase [Psychroflexus lacisalsi]|jgi:glycerol-3-phosphate dehydrogenase|uniref:Glycerol-3-phosphate dehydrogenase/oxidase n=1 Tax=Psychroflexus lacisalsi TaxID=503928 RepID=A0ABN1K308_9FLAO|nr:glycerol-3-phosphate dehydrogenase/oxidase [Psychroflexus lacisalsi]MBZ9618701.1 glycerol-3-phosphate dehydrogenase/oxidase [Psychroflexus lacisalsi]